MEILSHPYVIGELKMKYRDREDIQNIQVQTSFVMECNDEIINIRFLGKHDIFASGYIRRSEIVDFKIEEQFKILSQLFERIFQSYLQERIKRGYVTLDSIKSKKGVYE